MNKMRQGHTSTYIKNVDEAMLECYLVFAKTNKAFTT